MSCGAGMELHKEPVLHPSASPRWAQGRGWHHVAPGTPAAAPSWHGTPETGTQGGIPRAGISCAELKHSCHAPAMPIYLPAGRWMLLVEFFLSYRICAKLLQKIHALGHWE